MINADIKIYAPAIVQTAISASFESLRTLEIIVIDFEYLAVLTTLNTFKARSILSVFNMSYCLLDIKAFLFVSFFLMFGILHRINIIQAKFTTF